MVCTERLLRHLQLSSIVCESDGDPEGPTLTLHGRMECTGEYTITQEDIDAGFVSRSSDNNTDHIFKWLVTCGS